MRIGAKVNTLGIILPDARHGKRKNLIIPIAIERELNPLVGLKNDDFMKAVVAERTQRRVKKRYALGNRN